MLYMWCNSDGVYPKHAGRRVSMPHAAFYVVQPPISSTSQSAPRSFNAARSILCGATPIIPASAPEFVVSMPHAAFYVVQPTQTFATYISAKFQCRTQHFMWCNSVARSPCPARGERAFWKVVGFLCRFPLMGRNFHRKIAASIGVFPCAAQGCAKMENRDGRMRLCGIAVAFSTFLHHVCIIAENP